MTHERSLPPQTRMGPAKMGRMKMTALAILAGAGALTVSGVVVPKPALAWWRGGVWVGGPGPYRPYYAPRPYYYPPRPYYYAPPPVVVVPPPYYAPPPVVYAAPPPPAYYPPPSAVARTCYAASFSCPMEVPRAPGTTCYCSDSGGNRNYGTAR
jgi:hypothetical protein